MLSSFDPLALNPKANSKNRSPYPPVTESSSSTTKTSILKLWRSSWPSSASFRMTSSTSRCQAKRRSTWSRPTCTRTRTVIATTHLSCVTVTCRSSMGMRQRCRFDSSCTISASRSRWFSRLQVTQKVCTPRKRWTQGWTWYFLNLWTGNCWRHWWVKLGLRFVKMMNLILILKYRIHWVGNLREIKKKIKVHKRIK